MRRTFRQRHDRPGTAPLAPASVRGPHGRALRLRLLASGASVLLLAACSGADPEPSASDGTGTDETEEDAEQDGAEDDEPGGAGDGPAQGADPDDTDDPDEEPVQPVGGEPTTEPASHDGDGGRLTVTEVRVAGHDGFDRVVFELAGEGDVAPGWDVRYAPDGEPTAQGSGDPIEVEGEAALEIALHGFALPFDRPEGVEGWDGGSLDGPDDGVVTEVVEDTIFEGVHTFVVGTSDERPFAVEQLTSPDRVVLDVHHDGSADGS